ncbi:LysM peptidoglycan-binding domain-containing protein [Acidaminococcus fermentans]|uniref:LysM domain-containing protein n=1 Tax=Acidaminococcus fermentans TaxID=905 RepID=A0A1H2W3G5_ACIFE|nr:LysM peptidoglycan-binding domain-containing protein [Acidaminococcus fermentans]MDD6288328.1 LysM peptidoglycan-binding domain-containing protein [Acidaminococcus fermentans]SDW75172.1 LysM domain-containing protein [Acidaminococcus fermentans]
MKKLLLGLVLVLLGVSSYGVLQMEAAPTRYRNQQVVVFRGDSLWGIARRYTRPEEDVREVIDRIAKANHLDLRQAIQPGQKLTVPVKQGKQEKTEKMLASRS